MSSPAEAVNNANGANSIATALPSITAAFLVKFDDRKGYTIAWQKSTNNLEIEGVVEFKSMPSGLHNVRKDLVYFVYEDYAGISAVLNVEDLNVARKARVIAVGVLVPIEHGRLGKSWLQADNLRELAEKQIKQKDDDYSLLEEFWEAHKLSESPESEDLTSGSKKADLSIKTDVHPKPDGYQMSRIMSTGTVPPSSSYTLPAHHPALALPELLRLFGPLIFPLVRAALLRKRILFLGEAPVERTCNFVYNLSILSSLPKPIATILPNLDPESFRLRPLFNIGISDIAFLESESKSSNGWIACTTDDVICTKPELFDVLVILPNALTEKTKLRPYPKIFYSSPELSRARPKYGVRASQRDAKRFATLSKGLASIPRANKQSSNTADSSAVASSSDLSPDSDRILEPGDTMSIISTASSTISLKSVIEPQSWSRIAYTSLVWWASAGDKRGGLTETEEDEDEQDVALLTGENLNEEDYGSDEAAKTREIVCVQYFHRWSNLMFTALGDAIRRKDGAEQRYTDEEEAAQTNTEQQDEENDTDGRTLLPKTQASTGEDEDIVEITQDDIQNMGLDVWSQADRDFVEEMVKFWWERRADVQGGRVECCGMRLL